MKKTSFEHSFQLSFHSMNLATAIDAADHYIEVLRQAGNSKRNIFYADDCEKVRELIRLYESGDPLPISAKKLLESRSDIHQRCLKAQSEAL